jgi:hypothetical protein
MSSGALNPYSNPGAWDVVLVGQVTSPGICEVSEVKRAHEFDVKKGKGSYGATVTFVGRPPAKGSIKFKLWKPEHFTQWDSFRPLLKYDPTKKSVQAVDIYHPSYADVDLHSVVIESIGNIVRESLGLYSITVEILEYFPAPKKSAVSTPTQSQSTQAGTTVGTPPPAAQDAQEAEIAALMKQASAP